MSNSVGSNDLSMKISLDLAELDKSFLDAKKSFKQNIANLKSMKTDIKLKMDYDIAKLGPAASETQKLAVQEKYLTQQMKVQQNEVALLSKQYALLEKVKGANNRQSITMQTRLLRESKAMATLDNELQRVKFSGSINGLKGILSGNGMQGTAGLTALTTSLSSMKYELLGLAAAGGTLYGLYDSVKTAAAAGEALTDFSERLGISTKEAAGLSKVLKLGGMDTETFTGLMTRLDKSLLTAGEDGNDLTRALKIFGVTMTDSAGNLLPMNAQLDALAAGYKKANTEGRGQEFVAMVLGARGQELVKILMDLNELRSEAAQLPTSIMAPEDLKRVNRELNLMKVQFEGLQKVLADSLFPIVEKILPKMIELTQASGKAINQNPEGVSAAIDLGAKALAIHEGSKLAALAGLPIPWQAKLALGTVAAASTAKNYFENKEEAESFRITGVKPDANNAIVRLNPDTGVKEKKVVSFDFDNDQERGVGTKWVPLSREENNEIDLRAAEKKLKEAQENTKKDSAASAAAEEAKAKKQKEIEKATQALQLETYKLTHDLLTAQMHEIDMKAEKYRKEGVDEATITANVEAEKKKVREDFANNTMARLNSIYKTALQNRLDDIEREKKAFKDKGVSEVEATKWAEAQKKAAIQNSALEAIKTNRARLLELQDAIKAANSQGFVSGIDPKTGKFRSIDINNQGGQSGGFVEYTDPKTGEKKRKEIAGGRKVNPIEELVNGWNRKDLQGQGINPDEGWDFNIIQAYLALDKYNKDNPLRGILKGGGINWAAGASLGSLLEGIPGMGNINLKSLDPMAAIEANQPHPSELIASIAPAADSLSQAAGNLFPAADSLNQAASQFLQAVTPLGNLQQTAGATISAPITINIPNASVRDESDINAIAEKVASVIQPAIEQALGGQGNGY